MVNPMDVCVSGGGYTCKAPPPKFDVPKPGFCVCNVTLIIVGCSIDIFCLFVVMLLCIFNKTRSKKSQWIFINLCFAHLGLFSSFIAEAKTESDDAVASGFFDYFFFVSMGSVLVEAVAILTKVLNKTIPHAAVISGVCCWVLPVVIAIPENAPGPYSCKCKYDFWGPAAVSIFGILSLAITITLLVTSFWLLCRAPVNGEDKKAERKEAWCRIAHIAAIFVCFLPWSITLIVLGICHTTSGIVFIIFGLLNVIAILAGFFIRHAQKKEFRDQWTLDLFCCGGNPSNASKSGQPPRSPSVQPLELSKRD